MPIKVEIPTLPVRGELRFAVVSDAQGNLRSRYWRVSGTRDKSEIVLAPEGLGRWLHVTLHEDDAHWHYKVVTRAGQTIEQPWTVSDAGTGVRRAMAIEFRAAAVRYPITDRDQRKVDVWIGNAASSTPVGVELFILRSGDPVIRPAGRHPSAVGAIQMPDGRRAVLVASDWPAQERRMTVSTSEDDRLRAAFAVGDGAMLFGPLESDGALLVMDGPISPTR